MDAINYLSQIHFASLFFLSLAAGLATVAATALWFVWKPKAVSSDFISFFGRKAKYSRGPRWWLSKLFRILPYCVLVSLVLAAGNPLHENVDATSQKKTPYIIIVDSSGSTESAHAFKKELPASFEETVLNAFRVALMEFVSAEKQRAEFFFVLYSDTPYAARYFSGGKEAEIQAIKFLENLPQEIHKRYDSARRFYLQGTRTAFAIEGATRYRVSLPEEYSQSVFIILTDFEDTDIFKTVQVVNSLTESGLNRNIYFVVLSQGIGDRSPVGFFERTIKYHEQVHVFKADSPAGLSAAFRAISETEKPYVEISKEVLRSKSLRHIFIYVALGGIFLFVVLHETMFRRIP